MTDKIKVSPEQLRLLRCLQRGGGSQPKFQVLALFSKATAGNLLKKRLIQDDASIGYYSIKAKATVAQILRKEK